MKLSNKVIVLAMSAFITQISIADQLSNAEPGIKDFVPPQAVVPKDILVEQQDIYTISPGNTNNQTSSQGSVTAKPPISIWVDHKNNIYAIGEQIVISAKAAQNGYLTIIDVGTSGKIRQLFPNKYQKNNYLRKGDVIRIPAQNANFKYIVAGPTGKELIKAFLTKEKGSIYGKAESSLNNDVFPLISLNSKALRKDIITELNSTHQNNWTVYNKIIHIVPSVNNTGNVPQSVSAAQAAEQSLKLNRAQIRDIQRFLRKRGYYHGSIDGVIGSKTRQAISAWQNSVNLPATGYIDVESFAIIMN